MTELEKGSIKVQDWIVVAFATNLSPYEFELAQHLMPCLDKLKIPHHIEITENKGSWLKNVAEKPAVIGRVMEKYPAKNLVVLDADCEILDYPKLFDEIPEEYDLAVHYLNWESWYGYVGNKTEELLSGTMFIRNNNKMKELVLKWYNKANTEHKWEQKCLSESLEESPNIKIFRLPLNYCFINSLPDGKEPIVKCDNKIIVHFQASRIHKHKIK